MRSEVKARLSKEINYWDSRAAALKEDEKAGKKTRINWQNAARRAEDLAERMSSRMERLNQEELISSQPPRVRGGMVVVPQGLLSRRMPQGEGVSSEFSADAQARRAIELAAMEAVMAAERELGNVPEDVSTQKVGYDISSYDPDADRLRFIEVKGRIDTGRSITITRQEIITSLHEPEKFILAVVQVSDGKAQPPVYLPGALDSREPPFGQTAIAFDVNKLLERGQAPA